MNEPATGLRPGSENDSAEPRLVLASASPRRARILESAGLVVEVRPADTAEDRLPGDRTAEAWAVRLAMAKAAHARHHSRCAIALGADTMVVVEGEVLGKPSSRPDAAAMLKRLRGRPHRVITAVAVDGPWGQWAGWSETEVWIRPLSDREINDYVASGLPMDKAGGYGIQDSAFRPADRVAGCYLNVVGLPMCLTAELLELAGRPVSAHCEGCHRPLNTVVGRP